MARGPKLRGMNNVERNLRRLAKAYPVAAVAGLFKEEHRTIANAVERTPKDKGLLRASHHADEPVIKGNVIQGRIGFDKGYAVYVHERTELHHPIGEAKFLENAKNEEQPGMPGRVARDIETSVGL